MNVILVDEDSLAMILVRDFVRCETSIVVQSLSLEVLWELKVSARRLVEQTEPV